MTQSQALNVSIGCHQFSQDYVAVGKNVLHAAFCGGESHNPPRLLEFVGNGKQDIEHNRETKYSESVKASNDYDWRCGDEKRRGGKPRL
jgi:hypothetical protein